MTQYIDNYIDKAVVVAEIERRINENKKDIQYATHKHLEEYFEGYEDALVLFKEKFLDTLEVKEVNSFDATVCKIGNSVTFLKEMEKDAIDKVLEPYKNGDRVKVIIKAQKGE